MEYELPDPADKNQWVKCLMLDYKTLKGWEYDDKQWDHDNWKKFCGSAKRILEICGSLRSADACLMEYAKIKEGQGKTSWYLHNVVTYAYEWASQKRGGFNVANNAYRARLLESVAQRRRSAESAGLSKVERPLLDSGGSKSADKTGIDKNDHGK